VLERAIEDWLTKTVERNYLPAFCQVLIHQDHKVLYLSLHGQMERGKDLATIGPDGSYYAYQTKTGDINKASWRDIRGELQELIEFPIDHPSVDKRKRHRAYLVTNGTISEPVRLDITEMNEQNRRLRRKWAKLEVIDRFQLLAMFVEAQKKFFPRELPDMRAFLDLYLHNGRDLLPKQQLFSLLDATTFSMRPKKKSDALDALTGAVVLGSYLLGAFEKERNWFALIEGWCAIAVSIARFALRYQIKESQWKPSFDLVFSEVERNVMELRAEAAGRSHFLEVPVELDGDGLLRARTTIVLGLICWSEMRQSTGPAWQSDRGSAKQILQKHAANLIFWGESAFPFFFYVIRFLEADGEAQEAKRILCDLFVALVESNYKNRQGGFLPPYYDAEQVLGEQIPDQLRVPPPTPAGSSYIIGTLLDMLLRRGYDDVIKKSWRKYTHCQQYEFAPTNEWDLFAWRASIGNNLSSFPEPTATLPDLRAEAVRIMQGTELQRKFECLLGLYLMVCPFRATRSAVGYLDWSR